MKLQSRLVAGWPLKILQPLNRLADDSQRGVVNDRVTLRRPDGMAATTLDFRTPRLS